MATLRDALRQKYKSPRDVLNALGLDENLANGESSMTTVNKELAKTVAAIAARTVSFQSLATYLRPRLAMDAKPAGILTKAFDGVTGATFKEKKTAIAAAIRSGAKSLLAKDTSLKDVEQVLDMLEAHEVDGGDASVSEPQHKAMEAAAHGNSTLDIPQKVGEEFVSKDASTGMRDFMKTKGMGDDDINHVMSMMPKPATDETDEEKKKREKEEADKKAAEAAKDATMEEKDKPITKPAMDAAISAATDATAKRIRQEQRDIREAESRCREYVGEFPNLAFDSAEEVYRHALGVLGVPEAKTIHASALPTILGMQPKAGAREVNNSRPKIATDEASVKSFAERFPGASRIRAA